MVKTSATSQWALDSENNYMTQDARELKVHTAGEVDSLVQLIFLPKNNGRASMRASECRKAIDRYALAGTPSFMREA